MENHLSASFDEGGDSQMNGLIWYSWLGGVIIGTMVGANMVLEEHCKAGPRNVVITGRFSSLSLSLFFPPFLFSFRSMGEARKVNFIRSRITRNPIWLSQITVPLCLMEALGQFEISFAITCGLHNYI